METQWPGVGGGEGAGGSEGQGGGGGGGAGRNRGGRGRWVDRWRCRYNWCSDQEAHVIKDNATPTLRICSFGRVMKIICPI